MIRTRLLMGMPIIIEIVDKKADFLEYPGGVEDIFNKVFGYLEYIDRTFSPFKPESEISKINKGEIEKKDWSQDAKCVFNLAEKTKKETDGYFDIVDNNGKYNPSGIVKGWAIYNAAKILWEIKLKDFYINAGGDIQFSGKNSEGKLWKTGIKNPFNQKEIVKIVYLKDGMGIATSGNYIRGNHIYNPKDRNKIIDDIVSFTVIGPDVCEADRFATAVFAMGKNGIYFLEKMSRLNRGSSTESGKDFAGYMIDKKGTAYMTSNFEDYTEIR